MSNEQKVQHTPGPWYAKPGEMFIYSNDEICVASAYPGLDGGLEVVEKNARLIAAAPELLAALIEAVEDCGRNCYPEELMFDWLGKARAAIAKAKGE